MTSSNTFHRFITIGAAALLALSGSLISASPASAAVSLVTAPGVTPSGNDVAVDAYVNAITWASFAGVPGNYGGGSGTVMKWLICDSAPSVTSAVDGTDVPYSSSNCQDVYTSQGLFTGTGLSLSLVRALGSAGSTIPTANLIGKYVVRLEMSKNIQSQLIYGWAMSSPKHIVAAPTMSGPSGNVNGTVGTAMSMAGYTTSGFGASVVFSYAVAGGQSLPAGVSFDTTTGQITGTPTAAASNLSVTVTATGANGLTKFAVFNFTVTGGSNNNNQNQNTPTQTVAPTIRVVGTNAVVTSGTYSSGSAMGNWEYCLTAKAAVTTPGNNPPASDCTPLFLTAGASTYSNVAHELALDLTATYYARALGSMSSTMSAVSLAGKFVRYQESVGGSGFFTATVPALAGAVTSSDSTDVIDTPITED
ncbi:MAG: Ig domain-containing protein, partial [Rhodoluna sp.]|nr:Ig domain-containing protein [Rhodoluna sp.]